jgi:branched-chain amino acid aminotransferase
MNNINERMVWMNGSFIPESEAKISIFDSALTFGDMVFEMTRSFNKKQFKLKEHLERLYAGLKILRIPVNISINDFEKHIYDTIELNEPLFNDEDEHRMMIEVSRGAIPFYYNIKDIRKEPTVIIADFPLRWFLSTLAPLYDTGVNAVIPSQRSIPSGLNDPKIKSRSRLFYKMANLELSNFKGDNNWALLLDTDGFISEGTSENFFIVKNKTIITPEGKNILRGVSRGYVFELAEQLNLKCIEKNIEPYDVYNADEAFFTGTRYCIMPVTSLNYIQIGSGKFDGITKLLLDTWSKNVGLDIPGQIKKYYIKTN